MITTVDGIGKVRINFGHYQGDRKAPTRLRSGRRVWATTRCSIQWYHVRGEGDGRVEGWETLAEGYAQCSASDNYAKETGRQVSLKRAIAAWDGAVDAQRKAVLKAYYERPRGR